MRKILLASAAILMSAGMALAQSAATSPAPTGAPNAPAMAPSGDSPGNTGSNAPAAGTMGNASSGMSNGSMSSSNSPAPTGAPNAPVMTPPGASPGNTGSNTAPKAVETGMTGMQPATKTTATMPSNHAQAMRSSMKLPDSAAPETYLHYAKMAITHHEKMQADDALSHAETRLLDRAVPQGEIAADATPVVSTIEAARAALGSGNMQKASMETDKAMQEIHGMPSDGTGA